MRDAQSHSGGLAPQEIIMKKVNKPAWEPKDVREGQPLTLMTISIILQIVIAAMIATYIWLELGHPGLSLFEDGSYGLGEFPYWLSGCLFKSWGCGG